MATIARSNLRAASIMTVVFALLTIAAIVLFTTGIPRQVDNQITEITSMRKLLNSSTTGGPCGNWKNECERINCYVSAKDPTKCRTYCCGSHMFTSPANCRRCKVDCEKPQPRGGYCNWGPNPNWLASSSRPNCNPYAVGTWILRLNWIIYVSKKDSIQLLHAHRQLAIIWGRFSEF